MMRLTRFDGKPVFIDRAAVQVVTATQNTMPLGTEIHIGAGSGRGVVQVTEQPAAVMRMLKMRGRRAS